MAVNGIFQYRPTRELVNIEGMWPTFLPFDAPGIFSRDIDTIASVALLWISSNTSSSSSSSSPQKPLSILYPEDYLPTDNKEHLEHFDAFVEVPQTCYEWHTDKVFDCQELAKLMPARLRFEYPRVPP